MLSKPKKCDQDWLKMKTTDDGRICGKCQHTMVDFTKMSWKEIEQFHQENPGQCGMYSQKQLDHWGYEPPSLFSKCSKIAVVFSTLFSAINFQQTEAKPLIIQKEAIAFNPLEVETDSIPQVESKDSTILLRGRIIDEKTQKTLKCSINSFIYPISRASTDEDGVFEIEISNDYKWPLNELHINCNGYYPKQISVKHLVDRFSEISLKVWDSKHHRIDTVGYEPIYYGVPQPSNFQIIKHNLKSTLKKEN